MKSRSVYFLYAVVSQGRSRVNNNRLDDYKSKRLFIYMKNYFAALMNSADLIPAWRPKIMISATELPPIRFCP